MIYEIAGKTIIVIVSPSSDPENNHWYAGIYEKVGTVLSPLVGLRAFGDEQVAREWVKREFEAKFLGTTFLD